MLDITVIYNDCTVVHQVYFIGPVAKQNAIRQYCAAFAEIGYSASPASRVAYNILTERTVQKRRATSEIVTYGAAIFVGRVPAEHAIYQFGLAVVTVTDCSASFRYISFKETIT
jgi:hypothetical protein